MTFYTNAESTHRAAGLLRAFAADDAEHFNAIFAEGCEDEQDLQATVYALAGLSATVITTLARQTGEEWDPVLQEHTQRMASIFVAESE